MKIRTQLKAGLIAANHNAAIRVRSSLRAGGEHLNHSESLRVRSAVKAGKITQNHSGTMQVKSALRAGGHNLNHNEALRVRTTLKAGGKASNHNESPPTAAGRRDVPVPAAVVQCRHRPRGRRTMPSDVDDPIERAVQLHGDALRAIADGALERAQALATEALAVFEAESGAFHPDVANVLNCLAHVHEQAADYPAAEVSARRSVDIMRRVREQAGGEDIDRVDVQSLTCLGDVVRIGGRYDEAEPYLREAIAMGEASLGGEDADVLTALNSLAVCARTTGASTMRRRSTSARLATRRDALVPARRVPGLRRCLHNIGGLEHARGELRAPASWPARRAVETPRARCSARIIPLVAADLSRRSPRFVDGQGRRAEAETDVPSGPSTIFERAYGPDRYKEIAVNLNNLAGDPRRRRGGSRRRGGALSPGAGRSTRRRSGAEHPGRGAHAQQPRPAPRSAWATGRLRPEPLYRARAADRSRRRLHPAPSEGSSGVCGQLCGACCATSAARRGRRRALEGRH